MQVLSNHLRMDGKRIAFVPTMGFLHEGHLSLMRKGRELCDILIVSIFVNPIQFGPNEDFDTYPRDLENDFKLIKEVGGDHVFVPTKEDIYRKGCQTHIVVEDLPNHLCGISRPGFFKGVTTVVTKLFNIVKPHVAVFGEKDYQQLAVVRQMVKDLNLDIEIVGGPTVREKDGLAMSSRNNYLLHEQRTAALSIYESLQTAQKMVGEGIKSAANIIQAAKNKISSHLETNIDYISICDPVTLSNVRIIEEQVLMAIAVKVGKTRLIDNMILTPNNE